MSNLIEFVGRVSSFGFRVFGDGIRKPFEGAQILNHIIEAGYKSLPLVVPAGFALGTVMTIHTRTTLMTFGAGAMIPTVQALAFFVEIGPLVAGLLLAGRVGSGIGAVLANMRVTEQIDAIESLSIDSFKFLVVPRVLACVVALPLLTLFMDFAGLLGGYLAEYSSSGASFSLYIRRAFADLQWANFVAPTLKTAVFGFIIFSFGAVLYEMLTGWPALLKTHSCKVSCCEGNAYVTGSTYSASFPVTSGAYDTRLRCGCNGKPDPCLS